MFTYMYLPSHLTVHMKNNYTLKPSHTHQLAHVLIYTHSDMNEHAHKFISIPIHTCILTCLKHKRVHPFLYTCSCSHMCMSILKHWRSQAHQHAYTLSHYQMCTPAFTHIHTFTHTHSHVDMISLLFKKTGTGSYTQITHVNKFTHMNKFTYSHSFINTHACTLVQSHTAQNMHAETWT